MKYGIHLPLMAWDGQTFDVGTLTAIATTAESLGFDTLAANDHLVFRRPWLDGPTALASVVAAAPRVRLMTSVALPVVRGPVALAKSLAALDLLSGGRVVAGLGPGSTARDYEVVGLPFEERWARFEEAVLASRALWDPDASPFVGRFHDTTDIRLEPLPAQRGGPPIWIGSWGSEAGLARVARLADGWLASAYNTTPERFAQGRRDLDDRVATTGRGITSLPNTIGTMWLHLTDDRPEETRVRARLAELLRREPDELVDLLPIGPPGRCREILARYREAGAERVMLWPLTDERRQIERLAADVIARL